MLPPGYTVLPCMSYVQRLYWTTSPPLHIVETQPQLCVDNPTLLKPVINMTTTNLVISLTVTTELAGIDSKFHPGHISLALTFFF